MLAQLISYTLVPNVRRVLLPRFISSAARLGCILVRSEIIAMLTFNPP